MFVVYAMLGNAAVAAVLALLALAIGLACRSASIRHAAWVLVLLKLVTPPLFSVPLPVLPASWEAEPPANQLSLLSASSSGTNRPPIESAMSEPLGGTRYRLAGIADWALAAWVVGAVAWFVWQGRRIESFRRRVGRAERAPPEVSAAASRLAASLGISNPPMVKLATGIGSPMLWGWGRSAVVLFPRDLLVRLSPEARDTLLGHELAHFLRRDHWVRVLEFLATGLYWWHPAVWLARMGLEAAEEECCDAWVVGGLAASPRRYAEALLATVDFEAELRRPCLPPGACTANRSARLLQRRLVMLLDASRPGRLRGGNAIRAVLVAALFARPVLSAATPELIEATPDRVVAEVPRQNLPGNQPLIKAIAEPRSWATAAAPGGILTVMARDREVLLRCSDGTSRVLGPGRPLAVTFAPGGQRLATAGVWRVGTEGRPTALVTLEIYRAPNGTHVLSYEFLSLTEAKFALKHKTEDVRWDATASGLSFKELPDSPKPASTAAARLVQMRQHARRFGSKETFNKETVECRLISQPIDRYQSDAEKIVDGAIFALANGTNPETGIVLESDGEHWRYGILRLSTAEATVTLDGKQVAAYEMFNARGRRDGPYNSGAHKIVLSK